MRRQSIDWLNLDIKVAVDIDRTIVRLLLLLTNKLYQYKMIEKFAFDKINVGMQKHIQKAKPKFNKIQSSKVDPCCIDN